MLASRVLITAGTPDSMYLEDRQEKWLFGEGEKRREGQQEEDEFSESGGSTARTAPWLSATELLLERFELLTEATRLLIRIKAINLTTGKAPWLF